MPKPKTTAELINDLRGAVVKVQHNIDDHGVLWDLIEHLSGAGHLEVLGMAKGSAPVKGDYENWLKTPAGKAALKAQDLNNAFNVLVKQLFMKYRTADTKPAEADKAGKEALKLIDDFEKKQHIDMDQLKGAKFKKWADVVVTEYKELKKQVG